MISYHLGQGRNQLFILGGNFHDLSFDDVIVLIQPWYNFFANGHRQSSLRNIPKNEILLILIRPVTREKFFAPLGKMCWT